MKTNEEPARCPVCHRPAASLHRLFLRAWAPVEFCERECAAELMHRAEAFVEHRKRHQKYGPWPETEVWRRFAESVQVWAQPGIQPPHRGLYVPILSTAWYWAEDFTQAFFGREAQFSQSSAARLGRAIRERRHLC